MSPSFEADFDGLKKSFLTSKMLYALGKKMAIPKRKTVNITDLNYVSFNGDILY